MGQSIQASFGATLALLALAGVEAFFPTRICASKSRTARTSLRCSIEAGPTATHVEGMHAGEELILPLYEDCYTASGLVHLPSGRTEYTFGREGRQLVDMIQNEYGGRFAQVTTDAFGDYLPLGLLANIRSAVPGEFSTKVVCDFGYRWQLLEVVKDAPFKVARVQVVCDSTGTLGDDGQSLQKEVWEMVQAVLAMREKLGLVEEGGGRWGNRCANMQQRATEDLETLLEPEQAEQLSFVAAAVADLSFMERKALLYQTSTAERLLNVQRFLDPLCKELRVRAAVGDLELQIDDMLSGQGKDDGPTP